MHMCYERPGVVTALNGGIGYEKWDRGGGGAGGGGSGSWAGRDRERDRERERLARAHQMSHAHAAEPDASSLFPAPFRVTGNRDHVSQQIQHKLGDYHLAQSLIDDPSKSIGIYAEPPSPAPCTQSRRESEFKKPAHAPQNGRVHHRSYLYNKSDPPGSTGAPAHRPPPIRIPNGVQNQNSLDSSQPPIESILKEMKSLPTPLSVIAATPRKELENKFIFNPYTNKVQENPQLASNDLKTPITKPGLDNRISNSRSSVSPDVNKDLGTLSESDDEVPATTTTLDPLISPIPSASPSSGSSSPSDSESESSSAESVAPPQPAAPAPQPPPAQRSSWSLSNFAPPPAQPPEQTYETGKELRHAFANVEKPSPISEMSDSEASSPSPVAARRRRSLANRVSAASSDEEPPRTHNTQASPRVQAPYPAVAQKRGRPPKARTSEERPPKKKRGRPPKQQPPAPPPAPVPPVESDVEPDPPQHHPSQDNKTHIFRKVFTPKKGDEGGGKGGKGGKGKGGKGKGQVTIIEVTAPESNADDDDRRHRERSTERRNEEAMARVSPPQEPESLTRRREAERVANERIQERVSIERVDHRLSDDRLPDRPTTERTSNDRLPIERSSNDRLMIERSLKDRIAFERPSSERIPIERPSSDRIPIERPSSDRIPIERPSSDRLAIERPSDRITIERSSSDRIPIERPSIDRIPTERTSNDRIPSDRVVPDRTTERIPNEKISERIPERLSNRLPIDRSNERSLGRLSSGLTERHQSDRLSGEKTHDRLSTEKMAIDRKVSHERLTGEKMIERIADDKMVIDRLSSDKIPIDRLSDDKMSIDKLSSEKVSVERIAAERYVRAEADVGSGLKSGRGSERLEEASSNVVGCRARVLVRVPLARLRTELVRALQRPPPRRLLPKRPATPHEQEVVAATNHDRTGSCPGQTIRYFSYFERLPSDALSDEERDHKYYLEEATRLRAAAVSEQEPLSRVMLYLESVLCFVLTGRVLELELDTKGAFTIYRETIEYIKSIHSMPQRYRASPHSTFTKLDILSLRVKALLYLRMFKMYNREVKEYNKIVQEYQQKPACAEAAASPLSPTPSPGGSVGSVGSASAGSVGSVSAASAASAASAGSSGYCSLAHSVPAHAHHALLQLTKYYSFLYVAHDLWEQADCLCRLRPNQDLFIAVDRKCGPLSLSSTFRHLVQYVRYAISLLKSAPRE